MKISPTKIHGCYEIFPEIVKDSRGIFIKNFHKPSFEKAGLLTEFKEQYHSISHKNVVRGLHFQLPPFDHAKLVYCTDSEVMDFVLDIRLGSPTYGKYFSTKLNFEKGNMIYIPSGCAHGFCTLDKKATLIYNVTTIHNFDFDMGIKWDSAGIIWPIENPIVSEKDQSFPIFKNFSSPFIFNVLEK